MNRPHATQRGFSLVETIVAIGLLAGALTTLSHLVAVGIQTNALARQRTLAMILAEQKMEELRAERILSSTDSTEHVGEYMRRWAVAALPSQPHAVLIQVIVAHTGVFHVDARLYTVRARILR